MFYKKNILYVKSDLKQDKKHTRLVKRIRSVPGNNVLPVKSSAIIQPTDQISTKIKINNEFNYVHLMNFIIYSNCRKITLFYELHYI